MMLALVWNRYTRQWTTRKTTYLQDTMDYWQIFSTVVSTLTMGNQTSAPWDQVRAPKMTDIFQYNCVDMVFLMERGSSKWYLMIGIDR